MDSKNGVTLKNPTMAQRRAIVAIAKSESIKTNGDASTILDESYPWVWFSSLNGELSKCRELPQNGDKYVSFKKFIEYMYQPEEKPMPMPLGIWKCTKDRVMDAGDVAFKKGRVYEQIGWEGSLLLLSNEKGERHTITEPWAVHFQQVK